MIRGKISMKNKILIILIFLLALIINACLIVPELEPPVSDSGDAGDSGGIDDNDGNEQAKEYEIVIGFDSFVSSQFSYDELPDKMVITISKVELISGNTSTYHNLEKPIVIDLKQLLLQETMTYVPLVLDQGKIFDTIKLHLSSEMEANYILIGKEVYYILSKQRQNSVARIVNTTDLYFEAKFRPKMDIKNCRRTFVETRFDLKEIFKKSVENKYQISYKGFSVQYSCTPLDGGLDYEILMGFDATISSDYVNPPSNIFMNIVAVELENEDGSFRYHYAEPQNIDLIDTVLSGHFDIAPLIVQAGLYKKIRVVLSSDESKNYVVVEGNDYPLLSDGEELIFEINVDQDIDLIECQRTYLMTTFDLNRALVVNEEENEYQISSEGIDAITECKLTIDGNKALSAEVVRTTKITGMPRMGLPSDNPPTISKRYVKIIDGIKYTRIDIEFSSPANTPLLTDFNLPITIITNSERIQMYFIDDNGEINIISDTISDENKNEQQKNFLKKELNLVDFHYDMEKLIQGYGSLATRNKENNSVVIDIVYDGDEEELEGSQVKMTYDEETGLLLKNEVSYYSKVVETMPEPVLMNSIIDYTYSTYGNHYFQKLVKTTMSYDISIKELLGEEEAERMAEVFDSKEEDFTTITSSAEFDNLMSEAGSQIQFVPDPSMVEKINNDEETTVEIITTEEMRNVQISNLDDSFFEFK